MDFIQLGRNNHLQRKNIPVFFHGYHRMKLITLQCLTIKKEKKKKNKTSKTNKKQTKNPPKNKPNETSEKPNKPKKTPLRLSSLYLEN